MAIAEVVQTGGENVGPNHERFDLALTPGKNNKCCGWLGELEAKLKAKLDWI